MTTRIEIINNQSIEALSRLFNSTTNPTSCAFYGSKNHCGNSTRNAYKIDKWRPRGEKMQIKTV